MRRLKRYLLIGGAALGLSTAHAGGVLQGLEMDVMDADETAAEATARIALPRPGGVIDDANPDYASRATGQAMVGGSNESAASARENASDASPTSLESADDTGSGIGEPGETDSGGGVDGGIVGAEELPDSGVIETEPGETIVIDPIEVPIGELPIGEIIDGDTGTGTGGGDGGDTGSGGGDDGVILPEPGEEIPPVDGEPPVEGEPPVVGEPPVGGEPPVESDGQIPD